SAVARLGGSLRRGLEGSAGRDAPSGVWWSGWGCSSASLRGVQGAEGGALLVDVGDQVVPGVAEAFGPVVLQLRGESVDVDARLGELGQHRLRVAAVGGHRLRGVARVREGLWPGFWRRCR